MRLDYLKGLEERYEEWIATYQGQLIIIDGDTCKFGDSAEDFKKVNEILFPKGTDALDIYEWTTDWSDFFDDGHEWYGACCWSVYDKTKNRYVVMLVSATD